MTLPAAFGVRATDASHRVTTLELLFDLVFVFALTQVTALMAGDPSARGLFHGLVLLALMWFAWTAYAWLGNQARADEALLRACMVLAMGALFVSALAVPDAFGTRPDGHVGTVGLRAALVLALCYASRRCAVGCT